MMRVCLVLILGGLLCSCDRHGLEDLSDKVVLDMRYATTGNFTGQRLYGEGRCFLREATARKLIQVDGQLRGSGFRLKVYDCYRPLSVQKKMWEIVPDDRYVANPQQGSRHNRGAAVDVTLIRVSDGTELWMPTAYDDFTERAHRTYTALDPEQLENRKRLEDAMTRGGFVGLPTEWWHFDDATWQQYPVLDVDLVAIKRGGGKFATR